MASVLNNCDRCGSAVAPGTSVCPNCGAPLGGVDTSVSGVPPETVRTDPFGSDVGSANEWASIGAQMPVGDATAAKPASPLQEALPPVQAVPTSSSPPEQQVFSTPLAAAAPARKFPWLWIVGGCLALFLLACLLSIALGGWLFSGIFS